MRTIIAGGRDIHDPYLLEEAIIKSGFEITEVVSGAASGVDTLGEAWARANGIPVKPFPAIWRPYEDQSIVDYGAGPKRNQKMAEYASEYPGGQLIAIWDGQSKGTRDMIQRAKKAGLKVYVKKLKTWADYFADWIKF